MPSKRWLPIFGLPALVCALWTVVAGKDLNWDLLNYHYYAPYELLGGRLHQDFFAASAQSYLNPLGYVPFYLMVSAGWHSVVVSIVLAVLHSLSLAFLYLISLRLFGHREKRERVLYALLAATMGAATWVFWPMVGTSFLDPLLTPLVLGALLLLLDASRQESPSTSVAGALLGAAAGLKLSFAIYGIAALPVAFALPGMPRRAALRAGLRHVVAAALTFVLFAGPWSALLVREFGNPVFPLLNAWFRSPDAPPVNLIAVRFTPQNLADALTFPFRMIALDRALYSEIFAPDLRVAALAVGLVGLLAASLGTKAGSDRALGGADRRLFAFFGLAFLLWLGTSANGRYGLVVLLLAGVCLVRVIERLLPQSAVRTVLSLLLIVQVSTSLIAAPTRWFIAAPWSRHWLSFTVPPRAQREPALYLSVEPLPMAVVAPFLHPASSFANFRGLHSLAPDSPRLSALIASHQGHVRTLGRGLRLNGGEPDPEALAAYDATLIRIGYRVDPGDCLSIPWEPQSEDVLSRVANFLALSQAPHEPLSVVSCALRPARRDPQQARQERDVSVLFDRMERSCPGLFHGQTAVTEPLGPGWSRHYAGLDARLEALGGRVILHHYRAAAYVDLGTLADWERTPAVLPTVCEQVH